MIYQALVEAADRGTLLLVEGGVCRYYVRRDGVAVIREILVLPSHRKRGVGRAMLAEVRVRHPRATLRARCPASNATARFFYQKLGFRIVATAKLGTHDGLNTWELSG